MKSNRIFVIATVILLAGVVALGWFLGISPKIAEVAANEQGIAAVNAANEVEAQKLALLQQQFEDIDLIREELQDLEVSIPRAANLPEFILQLNALGQATGVTITSIGTGDGTIFGLPAGATATAAPADFVMIDMTLQVAGSYQAILDFTKGLQSGDRLFLVGNFSAAGGTPAASTTRGAPPVVTYTGNIAGLIYVLLDPSGTLADINSETESVADIRTEEEGSTTTQ